ncbi:MAG: hypothetical protein IK128_05700 [Clostridiales bacterium]|nr:hypothetical protein [Clostridiales bacterium]
MFLATLKNLFDIDDVGNRWGVRILYLFTVLINCAVRFNPYSDTNFDALFSWAEQVQASSEKDTYAIRLSAIPLTEGNIIFILTALSAIFLTLMASFLYSGLYIKAFRENRTKLKAFGEPIKSSALAGRMIFLTLHCLVIAIPFLIFIGSFTLLVVVALPFLFVMPSAYLSGDYGLFSSFPNMIKRTQGYYLDRWRGILLIMSAYFILDFLIGMVASFSTTAYFIINSALGCWIMMSFARYAANSYCKMMVGRRWRKMNLPGLIFSEEPEEDEYTDKLNEDGGKEE